MKEIVINGCFGGFNLSYDGVMAYAKAKGIKLYAFVEKRGADGRIEEYDGKENVFLVHYSTKPLKNEKYDHDSYFSNRDMERDDPALISVVKKLGEKANGDCAELKIVEIPDDIEWVIDEYDGMENIQEKHRSWS